MLEQAKQIIKEADVIVILSGAGLSVESGLDTFQSTTNSKNKIKNKKVTYANLTTQEAFKHNNQLAWAFHGQRFNSYKKAKPHQGYDLLLNLVKEKEDYFVVTSNIDSAHHKVGFEHVYEVHGRLRKFQCIECNNLWTAPDDTYFDVDVATFTLRNKAPRCLCGGITRPNVMLFGYDTGFNKNETDEQSKAFNEFMFKYDKGNHQIALIEIGAGESVRTIRMMSEFIHERVPGATLIRINPVDISVPDERAIVIQMNALEAIQSLTGADVTQTQFHRPSLPPLAGGGGLKRTPQTASV